METEDDAEPRIFLLIILATVLTVWVSSAGPSSISQPGLSPLRNTSWAGYAIRGGPTASVTYVEGSWTVPTVNCSREGRAAVLIWVGLDGLDNRTVEQIGVRVDCKASHPVYSAWYEYWNRSVSTIPIDAMDVQPGDVMGASVGYSDGKFNLKLVDLRSGDSFSNSSSYPAAQRNSGEWIIESPAFGNHKRFAMPDFGTVVFENHFGENLWRNYPVVNGSSAALDDVKGLQRLVYVCSGGHVKAIPSDLTPDGLSFSIAWQAGNGC